jgi:hypothetical protein
MFGVGGAGVGDALSGGPGGRASVEAEIEAMISGSMSSRSGKVSRTWWVEESWLHCGVVVCSLFLDVVHNAWLHLGGCSR